MTPDRSLSHFFRRCHQQGVRLTRFFLTVSVERQTLSLFERISTYCLSRKTFRCSTARNGIGQVEGSNRTPLGLHRIGEKIGGGWPTGAVFERREFQGYTWQGRPEAKITTRILWLEGLEPGINRGGTVDSRNRYIYIHGTGDETTLGRPASAGCIHLAAADLIPLYDRLPEGTLVWIER
jgi:L,D-transpeptidase-like protein